MRARLDRSVSLAEIAREACLSPFHLHRNFRALFGETPHQYVLRLRLDLAADRLRHTSVDVTEIALSVGFSSPAHFSRAFTRRYRLSPSQYRRRFGR
jgi:AraC family transcriptional regulator